MLVSCLAYSSTLKMEAIFSSKTSLDLQRTTWCYVAEDTKLHKHSCENLRSYKNMRNKYQLLYSKKIRQYKQIFYFNLNVQTGVRYRLHTEFQLVYAWNEYLTFQYFFTGRFYFNLRAHMYIRTCVYICIVYP
jgi:hypothetical protein